jgi:hypothetical protein
MGTFLVGLTMCTLDAALLAVFWPAWVWWKLTRPKPQRGKTRRPLTPITEAATAEP